MTSNNLLTNNTNNMYIRDWRKALGSPPSYRIGSTTFRFHFHFAFMVICVASLILIFLYYKPPSMSSYSSDRLLAKSITVAAYNYTYPLSVPITANGMITYRIGLIADLDKNSLKSDMKNSWRSFYKRGHVSYTQATQHVAVTFDVDKPIELVNQYANNGRGMELSELVTFNGRLLSFDDRTGFIYDLVDSNTVIPWILLMDGNGKTSKGFKSEWATVKDEVLYVGSMGKEWTTGSGEFESFDPMYVKAVMSNGVVHHINWMDNYKKIRSALGIQWPGYMIHESGMWSSLHRKWYFLPRRCSTEKYNETKDEHNGCNVLISAEENFSNIKVTTLGDYKATHGFSSMKFLPGTDDKIILALLTEELNGETSTYITAFTTDGTILLPQERIDTNLKYEGLEFI